MDNSTVKSDAFSKLSNDTGNVPTIEEALTNAEMNFTVEKRPLLTTSDLFTTIPVNDKYATVRTDTETVLGVVGNRYHVVQNVQAFEFLDTLVDSDEARYAKAGTFNNGALTWIQLELSKVLPISDNVKPYVTLYNTHDGSSAFKVLITPVRIWCQNTLRLAIKNATDTFSIRHTSSINGKIDEARKVLGFADKYYDTFSEEVEKLIQQDVNNGADWIDENKYKIGIVHGVPTPKPNADDSEWDSYNKQLEKNKEVVQNVVNTYNKEKHTGTAWGLIQAINSYEIWEMKKRGIKTAEQRAYSQVRQVLDNAQYKTNNAMSLLVG